MCRRQLPLFILLIILSFRAFPAVFVVTSNADTGPGTLRDALTKAAANGSATTDYINFNLPGTADDSRVIMINNTLPDLSANLVIDGTSQPGAPFGLSNAKVTLFDNYMLFGFDNNIFLGDHLKNITIRGLWLTSSYQYQHQNKFISITNSANVDIDNCLIQWGLIYISDCESFTFKSNIVGYLPAGTTDHGYQSALNIINTPTVVIGGTAAEGNLLSGSVTLDIGDRDMTYLISNNKMGSDYTGTNSSPAFFSDYGRIIVETGGSGPPGSGKFHGTITNNLIVNFGTVGISVSGVGDVAIKGNDIDTDETGTINFAEFEPDYVKYSLSYAATAILLQLRVKAIVGGSDPGDKNVIAFTSNGILEQLADEVVITQNSIFCLASANFNKHDFLTTAYTKPLPQVKITQIALNKLSGTATPGARVELFSNTEGACPGCDPRHFFTYVTANAQGNWIYNGAVPPNVVASAISNNQTSMFTTAEVDFTQLQVTQPHCGVGTGTIRGARVYNVGTAQWVDANGAVVSNSLDISNLPIGKYKLKVGSATCGAESDWVEIADNSVKIDASQANVVQPACSNSGSISGLVVTSFNNEPYKCKWTDKNLVVVGNTLDISGLVPGMYSLEVTDELAGCSKTYGPVVLNSTSGPLVNQATVNIQSSNCGQSSGAIRNVTVSGTGTLKYSWLNSQQQQVGTDKDLVNQPAGTYKLQVTDDSPCGPVSTTDIVIPETNGITLDESHVVKTNAGCGQNNGSITGITFTGATKFQWTDASHNEVATTADFDNAPAGDFTLTASNDFGCSKQSAVYHIDSPAPVQFPQYVATVTAACSASENGSIAVTTDALVKSLRWVDGQGTNVGNQATLTGLWPGIYQLYLTDQNGCEGLYQTYTVGEIPEFTIASYGSATNDQCGLKTGAIGETTIAGGVPPYTYSWRDVNGNSLSTTNAISGLSPGNYILHVEDVRCGIVDITYTINEESADVAPPAVSDVQLCSSGKAVITVNNPSANTTYRLYDSGGSLQPIDEQQGGMFSVNVAGNRSYFVSRLNGTCESSRAEIKVTVGISTGNINSAFTPNGDGVNDCWKLKDIASYPNALVQVFTRYGQMVFESKGYSKPFDGTMNGKNLPAGVYYYLINLNTSCNILSGSLAIIR